MPKTDEEILAVQLNWPPLLEVLDKVIRPWVAKKVIEYMGAEETIMVNMVLRLLR